MNNKTSLHKCIPIHTSPSRNQHKITCGCETCIISILLQYDMDKNGQGKMTKFEKIYESYINEVYPNDSHIYHRASDALLSYYCNFTITELSITR